MRRVLVVISDGEDNLSDRALSDAIEIADPRRSLRSMPSAPTPNGLPSPTRTAPKKIHVEGGDKILKQFAEQTGGRVFFPYRVDDLAQSFVDIGTELRSQYFIAYSPTSALANGPVPEN